MVIESSMQLKTKYLDDIYKENQLNMINDTINLNEHYISLTTNVVSRKWWLKQKKLDYQRIFMIDEILF